MPTETLNIEGKRYVLIPAAEYDELRTRSNAISPSGPDLPPLPKPDRNGNVPAVAYARAAMARKLILARHSCKLTQTELAKLARVRPETISRIETGKHTADPKTIDKLDRAIRTAAGEARRPARRTAKAK